MHDLVKDYLVHYGYVETLSAMEDDISQDMQDIEDNIKEASNKTNNEEIDL